MLKNISFKNFLSFLEAQTLYLEATDDTAHGDSVLRCGDLRLLPVSAIYGANASGKTNALYAIRQMRMMLTGSVALNPGDRLPHSPFLLSVASRWTPVELEAQFVVDGSLYRYGFSYTGQCVREEWLYCVEDGSEVMLFERQGGNINIDKAHFAEGEGKDKATPPNRLFLSLVAQLNGQTSRRILDYWTRRVCIISGSEQVEHRQYTQQILHNGLDGHDEIRNLLASLDSSATDFVVEEDPVQLFDNPREMHTYALHKCYDEQGREQGTVKLPIELESQGTRKLFDMAGSLIVALRKGYVVVVDELEAKLHPHLTGTIIDLFMNPMTNRTGGQLIFSTHDTTQLNPDLLRRDQIWFVEKDERGRSSLYSLAEFASDPLFTGENLQLEYLRGRFGAVPNI